MTKQQAEIQIREVQRRCRGPYRKPADFTPKELKRLLDYMKIEKPEERARMTEQLAKLNEKGAQAIVTTLLRKGFERDAREVGRMLRRGCGYDFNTTILAGPMDGEVHPYVCPKCGVSGTYRAPLFEIEPEPEFQPAKKAFRK